MRLCQRCRRWRQKLPSPISMPSKYPLIRRFVSVWGLTLFQGKGGNTMRSKHRRLPQLLRFKHMWQSGIEPRYPFGVASQFLILETGLELNLSCKSCSRVFWKYQRQQTMNASWKMQQILWSKPAPLMSLTVIIFNIFLVCKDRWSCKLKSRARSLRLWPELHHLQL